MTREEYSNTIDKIEQFDELSRRIDNVDNLIDALENRIKIQEIVPYQGDGVMIELSVNGTANGKLLFSVEQATKLKEILVSYRSDVYKRREEL